jgi:hypothetical protein
MSIIDRWRNAFRWNRDGKAIAETVAPVTGTSKERGAARHAGELYSETLDILAVLRSNYDAAQRLWVARNVYQLVVQAPTGDEGTRRLYQLASEHRAAGEGRNWAPRLAYLLVLVYFVADRADGDGFPARMIAARVQGEIERFIRECGVKPWGVVYANRAEFERLRQTRPTAEVKRGARSFLEHPARLAGIDTSGWGDLTDMSVASAFCCGVVQRATSQLGNEVGAIAQQKRTASAVAIWVVAIAVCDLVDLVEWNDVGSVALLQLHLADLVGQGEGAAAALGTEVRITRELSMELMKSESGKQLILPINVAVADLCRTGQVDALSRIGNAVDRIAKRVEFVGFVPRIVM